MPLSEHKVSIINVLITAIIGAAGIFLTVNQKRANDNRHQFQQQQAEISEQERKTTAELNRRIEMELAQREQLLQLLPSLASDNEE